MRMGRHLRTLAMFTALVALPDAAFGQNLTAAQVGQIISAAVQEANARGVAVDSAALS